MLRFVVWLAVVVFSDTAWAQTAEAVKAAADAANAIQNQGGILGSVAVLAGILACVIIVVLYRKIGSQDKEIRELNGDLVTAVRQAETTSANVTNALQSLEKANRAASDVAGERWDAVKGMSVDIVKVALLVEGNKASIATLQTVLEGLRSDIQQLWRRPQP